MFVVLFLCLMGLVWHCDHSVGKEKIDCLDFLGLLVPGSAGAEKRIHFYE